MYACGVPIGDHDDVAIGDSGAAHIPRIASERRQQRIDQAIECKALRPSFPLVVSRIPRAADEGFHHLILAHTREPEPGEVYTVLVVDDDPGVRLALTRLLR